MVKIILAASWFAWFLALFEIPESVNVLGIGWFLPVVTEFLMVLQRSTLLKLDLKLGQVDLTLIRHTVFWTSIWPQHFIKQGFFIIYSWQSYFADIIFNFLYITSLRQLFTATLNQNNTFKIVIDNLNLPILLVWN